METTHSEPIVPIAPLMAGHLSDIVAMMRQISQQSDPRQIFREYATRVRQFYPVDHVILIREPEIAGGPPLYTEVTDWDNPVHPWADASQFQILPECLMSQLYEQGEACVITELDWDTDDPFYAQFQSMRSLRAVPLFEQGEARRMIVGFKSTPAAFREEDLPALVWLSNLFGRAIQNLLLAEKLKTAYQSVDREMKVIGEIQHSLLPANLPIISGLEVATYYKTSKRAGGDYYDFFPLADGKWGILIADVSGHGTPAAVVMAIIHTIAHTYTGSHDPPSQFLNYLNEHLTARYTTQNGTFVTAFYGVFDPQTYNFRYSSAGHNPPIRRRCGATTITLMDKAGRLPLGISADITYDDAEELLYPGDRVVLYTDGMIEEHSSSGEMFGVERLGDLVRHCDLKNSTIIKAVVQAIDEFSEADHPSDDRTLVVLKVH